MRLCAPLLFFASLTARAETLSCRADFDETSHYEVSAPVAGGEIGEGVLLRFVSEEGDNLRAELKATSRSLEPGRRLSLAAKAEGMDILLRADWFEGAYEGVLRVRFHFDGVPDVEAIASCRVE